MPPRVRAPELLGRSWLNTDPSRGPLRLADLRGRFVLLDFWTFCCVNCLHVLEELRPLEAAWAEELVVIGVHSPKFEHEADADALRSAVARYGVHHPVLDDPELVTWSAYAARAWPTLVLIDPDGYVVATYAGEGHGHAIDALLRDLAPSYRLTPAGSPYVPPAEEGGELRFPASAVRLPDGDLLVADAGHDAVVRLPSGRRYDGFLEPNGLCLLPAAVAAEVGYDVVVADTGADRLAGLDLATGRVVGLPLPERSTPWDVVWWRDRLWTALAGPHQLWTLDPRTGSAAVAAGTGHEGLVDGPLADAWFAQPSALAADGDVLWVADAETSALRRIAPLVEQAGPGVVSLVEDAGHGRRFLRSLRSKRLEGLETEGPLTVTTAIGEGLFDFGFRDGPRADARLQHPLGVAVDTDGTVLVADTYNGAIRRFDPTTGLLSTVATGLAEPSGVVVGEPLLVVESAAHRLTEVVPTALTADGRSTRTQRPVTVVAPDVELRVAFAPPPGQHVDDRFGPATQLVVSATPDALLRSGDGRDPTLSRSLRLDPTVSEGVLRVAARAATCDVDGGEGAACRLHQQDWGIPVRVAADGVRVLDLPLGGAA